MLLLTLICAMIVISTVYYLQDVAPFGSKSLLTIDFFHQYGPMLGELVDRIRNGQNLVYSFYMGMGLPFFRNFFNYLSSPFNIILFLFKHSDLLMSYSVIIGLKAVAAAGTINYYLRKKFNDYNNLFFITLSILYAFSAYFTAYYWNIMWMDGMVFLPLITLGIENIVNNKKPLLYIISLSIMLFANYFIAYMLCLFSVLYFLLYMFIKFDKFEFKKILKKCLIFGVSSLLAAGLCAFFLVPLYNAIKGISATSDVFPTSQYYSFTFKEFIFNHLSAVGSTVLKSGITSAPNISCGITLVALLILFIINPKIDIKIKFSYLFLVAFLMISYIVAPLDFIWHAFHVPNDLPYRYSFIYSFVLIIIGAYAVKDIKEIKPVWVTVTYIICLLFILGAKLLSFANITDKMLLLNAIIITIMYLVYILVKYFDNVKKWAPVFTIITAVFECIIGINNNWEITHDLKSFYNDYDTLKEDLKFVSDNSSEFYRIEREYMLSFNDNSWYGYPGVMAFSSMEYENLAILVNNLGMPGNNINSFYYKNNTPIYNIMFNLKYVIGYRDSDDDYTLYYEGNNDIYKSKYAVGLMFGVNKNVNNWNYNFISPFKNQNDFVYKTTGIDKVFYKNNFITTEEVIKKDDIVVVKYVMKNMGENYYFYINDSNINFVYNNHKLYYLNDDTSAINDVKNISIDENVDYNEKFIVKDKGLDDEIVFYVGYNTYVDDTFEVYSISAKALNEAYNYYLNNKLTIREFKENYIFALSDLEKDAAIYTSIPYDEGWEVYVDGEKVETYTIGNALLGFDLSAGEHEVILKYRIPYLNLGLIISSISLIGTVIINMNFKRKKKFRIFKKI
jgi:uncharacterized membrane protein YfhO